MKLLIADDHGLFREGMKLVLAKAFPEAELFEAESAAQVSELIKLNTDIDLLLLDLSLTDQTGTGFFTQLRQDQPPLPIAIISAQDNPSTIREVLDKGAAGYIPKTSKNTVMISAINLMISGGVYIPNSLLNAPVKDEGIAASKQNSLLTNRQKEVLQLLEKGLSNKQIGYTLNIAPGTIKSHIGAIFQELKAHNRTQAVSRAKELHLLE